MTYQGCGGYFFFYNRSDIDCARDAQCCSVTFIGVPSEVTMRQIAPEIFQEMVEAGHETRNIEFKPAFAWDDGSSTWVREKVIQAILGMTNTRDGGTIVIGVSEVKGVPNLSTGVIPEQLASFDRYDDIKGVIDSFGSNVNFSLGHAEYKGQHYVVIGVREFELAPSICKRDGVEHARGYLLRKGDIYARALNGHESTIRVTDTEMAEIMQMAVDKNQHNLHERGWRHETDGAGGFAAERGDF